VLELEVGFYKKNASEKGITYKEAVDQALCFGWIDGVRNSVDETRYKNRFTPRKPKSIWSAVNIKRVGELAQLGLMHPAGQKVFDKRDVKKSNLYSFERENVALSEEFEKKFQENKVAWEFFKSKPPSYQKPALWWVMSAKQEETRLKRLTTLIEDSEKGRKISPLRRKSEKLE